MDAPLELEPYPTEEQRRCKHWVCGKEGPCHCGDKKR